MLIDHKCAYIPCECMVSGDERYCSESCRYNDTRAGARVTEEECDCGHEGCAQELPGTAEPAK